MSTSCTEPIPVPVSPGALRFKRRLLAAIVALACGTLLLLAAWMRPSTAGLGTHQQLGLAPCGWIVYGGIPCPSCGMTTSFAHAADGNFLGALKAQPAGAVLAFLTACTLVIATWQVVTGERLLGFCTDRIGARVFMCFGALVLLAWIYKILVFRGVF